MKTINYNRYHTFDKSFKKLLKKFKTLEDDLAVAKRNAIELLHQNNLDNDSIVLIPGFTRDTVQIFKLRKFSCKSLKGCGVRSGIRIIYAFCQDTQEVTFLEIYFKQDQESETTAIIKSYLAAVFEVV